MNIFLKRIYDKRFLLEWSYNRFSSGTHIYIFLYGTLMKMNLLELHHNTPSWQN
jgi:hypothetical protein